MSFFFLNETHTHTVHTRAHTYIQKHAHTLREYYSAAFDVLMLSI